jgi:hypothetical protein
LIVAERVFAALARWSITVACDLPSVAFHRFKFETATVGDYSTQTAKRDGFLVPILRNLAQGVRLVHFRLLPIKEHLPRACEASDVSVPD